MNLPGTAGESSCKRQENGDGSETERPLKKARFAWEVKGKYHLRNELSQGKPKPEATKAGSSLEHEAKLIGNTEQNLEILGDYLLKQDFNTLDSITDSNALLPSTSISTEKISYPRYVSSFESSRGRSESGSSNVCAPIVAKSVVYSNKDSEDQCIAKWQARQMAKCFVDNTINRVLDSWMIAPLPAEMDNNSMHGVFALDAAEFINNLPGDNSIENEAILMAISAHGLQNNSSSSNETNNLSQSSSKHLSISPPSSPLPSDDEIIQSNPCNTEQNQIDENSSNDFDMTWSSNDVKQNDNSNLPVSFYPDTSNFSYQYFSESDNPNSSNTGYDGEENLNSNDNNHFDFLDAAVSFAIQYKGLTSYGTDYG
ncbi:uncharacterized protein LOC112052442 [Bicyclus anynana]|uniref:Uncharacterized protein LOC112052442 n=1 Tax=Bicyclus anynana TaxID=110368 RepID=A0A6J1NV86_BICAN|nr:uncharacterized protein LOC112052442 [Bicyclus anynana]